MEANMSALSSSLFFHGDVSHISDEGPSRLHQLTASFTLDEAEVAFFDAVMAALPAGSTSFSELKHAYSECKQDLSLMRPIERAHALRAPEDDAAPSTEARLWNTLLSLVQVRGHTWAERWDAIRVSLGLEPLDDALWSPTPGSPPAAERTQDALPTGVRPTWSPLQLVHQRVPPRALDAVRWPRVPHETLLERRAADLERRYMRRFLVRWNDTLFACVSRQERAAHAHAHLVALRTWAHWRARYAAQHYATDAAVVYARNAIMRQAWKAWRTATSERLQARHKAQARTLRAAFLTLAARRDARVGRIAMTLWMQAWHGRQARQYRRRKLLPRAWDAWRTRVAGLATLESKRLVFVAYAHRRLLGAAIDAWRQRLGEQRRAAYQAESAMAWDEQRLLGTAWRQWAATRQHCTTLQKHAAHLAHAHAATVLRTCLHHWYWATRSAQMGAQVETQRLRVAWHRWWVAYTDTTLARQAAVRHAQDQSASRRLVRVWTHWRQNAMELQRQAHAAARTSAYRTRHAAWHAWRHALTRCQQNKHMAAERARMHCARTAFAQWRGATRTRKADAWLAHRLHHTRVHAWERWRFHTVQRRHARTCVALVVARRDAQVTRTHWRRWRAQWADHQARTHTAVRAHDRALQRRSVRVWHAQWKAYCARAAHAQSWHEARHATTMDVAHEILRVWQRRTRLAATERAVSTHVARDRTRQAWRRWRDALVEVQLRHEELAALAARRQCMLRACWTRWMQRTYSLPVLQWRHRRQLQQALARWRQHTRARILPRLAKAFALSTIGSDALASWRHRVAHREQVRSLSYVL
ncbi:hypothetical protein MNAN1_001846 [Malassezia nana]|uniref:Sfi1 spindle body domain-containing protein n=1 Tax=Malassezia nana TaxID=180528 RepID=A0AAF0J2B4_9BASI|nr:hypothetical protein MNAN1_001846 [Malassezia nana]